MMIQPLIASAFSTYSVAPSARVHREVEDVRNDGSAAGMVADQTTVQGPGTFVSQIAPTESTERTIVFGRNDSQPKIAESDRSKPHNDDGDVVDLSETALKALESREETKARDGKDADALTLSKQDAESEAVPSKAATMASPGASELTPEEQQQIEELKARDAEVRTHEAAHLAAAGPYATSGASYTFQTGPDGQKYAIGGEVSIDMSEVSGDPEATIQKMQTVVAAALAPAEPSGQDHKVAAAARQTEAKARAELAQMQRETLSGDAEPAESTEGESSNESPLSARKPSPQSAAYGAQSTLPQNRASQSPPGSMTSGQTGGSSFSAFA